MTMKPIEEVYPDFDYGTGDYDSLLESFGYEILLQVDDNDYQGDSRVLYKNNDQYGILIFGWGSCSGCDALQACTNLDEVDELRNSLHEDIVWRNLKDTIAYVFEHDWQGNFGNGLEFAEEAKKVLSIEADTQVLSRAETHS